MDPPDLMRQSPYGSFLIVHSAYRSHDTLKNVSIFLCTVPMTDIPVTISSWVDLDCWWKNTDAKMLIHGEALTLKLFPTMHVTQMALSREVVLFAWCGLRSLS